MSDYIVSARKYRPDSFESLIGQDNIARTLKNSIRRGQLAHAYLFCGPRGVGKTTAARIFAKTINCANPGPDMDPCGECDSCRSFQEGRSFCIHELDAASNNGVDDIKALMDQVQIPPQVGRYSVYIIDEVHMLTQSAFNAFLKTLEEPPAHAIFILATTEKHKIIPTILSRCQTYDFNRISIPDIVRNLRDIAGKEGITIDDESMHIIANKADGAMRDALTIFDQTVAFCGTDVKCEDVMRNLNVLDYEYSFRLVDAFLAGDYATALLIFDEVLSKGFNAQHFVAALSSHLRDLLVSRTGGLEGLLDLPDSLKKRYAEQAARCSVKFIYDALGITTQCDAGYKASTNQRLHIEFALMRLSFLSAAPATSAVSAAQTAPSRPSAEPEASVRSGEAAKPAPATAPVADRPRAAQAAPAPVMETPAPQAAKAAPEPQTEKSAPKPPAAKAAPEPQAAQTAPASPEAPAVSRRRPAKSGSNLSFSSLMSEEEQTAGPEEENGQAGVLPEDDLLRSKWSLLPSAYKDKPRLESALSKSTLKISEEEGRKLVEFTVTNEAQKRWIEEKVLRELERRYCDLVGSTAIRLAPSVLPDEQKEDVKYMPVEKAEDLMGKNEEVRNLVQDLSLDVK